MAKLQVSPLALAPAAPAAESCFTKHTGDAMTDFTNLDAQALRDALAAGGGRFVSVATFPAAHSHHGRAAGLLSGGGA